MKHAVVIPLAREHADELRGCGTVTDSTVTVDRESECYKAWREKHKPAKPKPAPGPGDYVKAILVRLGAEVTPSGAVRCPNGKLLSNCGCEQMRRQMNSWGFAGCIARFPTLKRWFTDKARQCGMEIDFAAIDHALTAVLEEFAARK